MKTVSIITLNGYSNYGNRLQLFALSKTIESMGCQTTVYWKRSFIGRLKSFMKTIPPANSIFIKEARLRSFSKNNTPRIDNQIAADYCVVGSDQVWNPLCIKSKPYLLNPRTDGILVSYAASIGVDNLDDEMKAMFREALKNYNAISVRERSAKAELQPLTNKKIEVVLDPTLLISPSRYKKMEKKPAEVDSDEKYILYYVLGNRESEKCVNEYADKMKCKVIVFSDKKDSDFGVEEFLYLIHHAELICTDSFHACVFSFLFDRPFVVFRRTGESDYMYSRIQNLIDVFQFKNREFNGQSITKENATMDYTKAKIILKKEQEKSIKFLEDVLEIKHEG